MSALPPLLPLLALLALPTLLGQPPLPAAVAPRDGCGSADCWAAGQDCVAGTELAGDSHRSRPPTALLRPDTAPADADWEEEEEEEAGRLAANRDEPPH